MGTVKKILQVILLCFLLLMGIGQLPSYVGRTFLLMALLFFPNRWVQDFVDDMLEILGTRWMVMILLTIHIFSLPMSDISLAGQSLGKFLHRILQWFP